MVCVTGTLHGFANIVFPRTNEALDLTGGHFPELRPIWLMIYGISFLMVLFRAGAAWKASSRNPWILLLIVTACASLLWSVMPSATFPRLAPLVGSTFLGVQLASKYSPREQLRFLTLALAIVVVLSWFVGVALPQYGRMIGGEHNGNWKGILLHKNDLGRLMVMSAVAFFCAALDGGRFKWASWLFFLLSAGLALLSQSKQALLIFFSMIFLIFPLYRIFKWHYRRSPLALLLFAMLVVIVGAAVASLVLTHMEALSALLGRDVTLTGRTKLWPIVLDMIRQKPWLGYGYGAFWLGREGEFHSQILVYYREWMANHAHNGFLEVSLDLGLLGLTIYLIGFFVSFTRAFKRFVSSNASECLWVMGFMTLMVLYNLSSTTILTQNNIFWIIYVAVSLSIFGQNFAREKT